MKIKGLRWYIAGLLCLTAGLNYLDRQALSILIGTIQKDIPGITDEHYSIITSAFLASYTVMYAVSGLVIDKLGTRKALAWFVSGWSVASLLHAVARTVMQFSLFRFLLGATEAANFPAGIKAVSEWFPMRERALAIGIFNAGTAIGACIAAPIIVWISLAVGWRMAFVISGGLGLVWLILWLVFFKPPRNHPMLTEQELAVIESGQTAQEAGVMRKIPLGSLLKMKEAWGCIVARMLTDPISYFLAFWVPKFLQDEHNFSLKELGIYSSIPFAALALGNIAGGAIPRWLIGGFGWNLNRSRKTVMAAATILIPLSFLLVVRAPSPALAVTLLCVAMFSHAAWANMTLPAEVFPKHVVGTISGFGGAMGGLMGVLSQLAIGQVAKDAAAHGTTPFMTIFTTGAILYPIAFIAVCLLVRRLGEVREVKL
jgi:ACS family hexuronate transporter-like MFS transporter